MSLRRFSGDNGLSLRAAEDAGTDAAKQVCPVFRTLRLEEGLLRKIGAGEGARTLDPDLGKVVLYH